jgi:hypothetical protein
MLLTVQILGALGALGLGIWLGLPGRYEQTPEEIEEIMKAGGGQRRRAKRHFTPLAWLQRKASPRTSARRSEGRFQVRRPEDDR